MPDAIRFCFDDVSPYAYLAWTQIHSLAERRGVRVVPVPVVFGAILDARGQKVPAEIPAKRAYLFRDCIRMRSWNGSAMAGTLATWLAACDDPSR